MPRDKKVNYLEIPTKDISLCKIFFKKVFNWEFVDYGEEYTCFTNGGIDGGFYKSDLNVQVSNGSPLIVLYSKDLEAIKESVIKEGGKIIQDIYSFPGGRRFHFIDPTGNEYAVWSE